MSDDKATPSAMPHQSGPSSQTDQNELFSPQEPELRKEEPELRKGVTSRPSSFVKEHLALLLSAVPVLLVFLRVARVAGLEPSALAVLVQTVDIFRLTLMTLIQVGPPLFLMTVGLSFVVSSRQGAEPDGKSSGPSALPTAARHLFVTILFLAVFATSPGVLLIVAVYVAFNFGFDKLYAWYDRRRRRPPLYADSWGIFATVFALFLLAPNTMWLPAERIDTRANETIIGYVLSDNDGHMTVMVEKTRRISTIDSISVANREPCRLESASKPLLAYGVDPTAQLPSCPK